MCPTPALELLLIYNNFLEQCSNVSSMYKVLQDVLALHVIIILAEGPALHNIYISLCLPYNASNSKHKLSI